VFAANDNLTATDLNALAGPWNAYTPTLGGWTLGNGTISGAYLRFGALVIFRAEVTIGSSTTITATAPTISLPTGSPGATGAQIVGATCDFVDDSAATRYPGWVRFASGDTTKCQVFNFASPLGLLGTSSPFTWAASDKLRVSGFYETSAGSGLDADSSIPLPEVSHPNTTDTLVRVWDVDEDRWQTVHYDSGLRSIVATSGGSVTSGAYGSSDWGPDATNAGYIRLRRVNSTVTAWIQWADAQVSSPTGALFAFPSGFGVSSTTASTALVPVFVENITVNMFTVGATSFARNQGTCGSGDAIGKFGALTVQWQTDQDIPSSLPGTAIGSAPA
jgi:hypothetical protein